jgi:quercetin dioxygenase-like cupin family protein
MKNTIEVWLPILTLCSAILFTNCSNDNKATTDNLIFSKGELGPEKNFTGKAYNLGLVSSDSIYNTLVGNVYFEKGARSNWHVHPSGQILIVLDGEGYHQLEGQPKQTMRKGDVIKCPPKIKHWHGATESSSLTQMYILPKTEKGIVTWLEPVTDEQYKSK